MCIRGVRRSAAPACPGARPPPRQEAPLDYRNQAAVPDHQRYSDNWREMSESTR